MHTVSIFNNKGGVGKTTLTFNLAHALAEMGKRTLLVDLDPQCNLTILSMEAEELHQIWEKEDAFIADFASARESLTSKAWKSLIEQTRSIHFLLKPTEDGVSDFNELPPARPLAKDLDLLPGRLTLHMFEEMVATRWSDALRGTPLALRTLTKIRALAIQYAERYNYDYIIFDTSPSLGILNKVVISTTDGIIIPCMPDMFSLYGIRNIGNSLKNWKRDFDLLYSLLSEEKRALFPERFVHLLGYTIYNAKKYSGKKNAWNLATAHYNYALQIPITIETFVDKSVWGVPGEELMTPIGGTAVMHTHNTLPNMAQKYHLPIWRVPEASLDTDDISTIAGNRTIYEDTRGKYEAFAHDLLTRVASAC